jgi:flagellar motor switch protein FliG
MSATIKGLTGRQKAAILMIVLGPELSVQAFKHLNEREIEAITMEIANIRKVSPEQKEEVLEEFHEMLTAQQFISEGGIDYAKDVLERAIGGDKAYGVINRLKANMKEKPFESARKANPKHLLSIIGNESPQTIALILAHLEPGHSSDIIAGLETDLQVEVAKRMALLDTASPEVINNVEEFIDEKLSMYNMKTDTTIGGIDSVVTVLNRVDRGTEKSILQALEIQDPALAQSIRDRMFVFEDIVTLEDRYIQVAIRQISDEDLLIALRVASDEMKNVFFKNMSSRKAEQIKEEMEFMGPIKLRDVEEAQSRIVNIVRDLEEQGEIVINAIGDDVIV